MYTVFWQNYYAKLHSTLAMMCEKRKVGFHLNDILKLPVAIGNNLVNKLEIMHMDYHIRLCLILEWDASRIWVKKQYFLCGLFVKDTLDFDSSLSVAVRKASPYSLVCCACLGNASRFTFSLTSKQLFRLGYTRATSQGHPPFLI